jgi:type III pantothenate kinase
MLLAIDVGNTKTKVHNLSRGGTLSFDTPVIRDIADAGALVYWEKERATSIIGASVVPNVRDLIDEASYDFLSIDPVWIDASSPLGLKIGYKTPETLGADRIANVLGAFEICNPPFVVVDLGTATKFEVVDREGTYVGGSIMPSSEMGLRSLKSGTSQLPSVQLDATIPLIGTDTKSAILTGAALGHRFGVGGLTMHYVTYAGGGIHELERFGVDEWLSKPELHAFSKVTVVVTGGNASQFPTPEIGSSRGIEYVREPRLTALGLEVAARRLGLQG